MPVPSPASSTAIGIALACLAAATNAAGLNLQRWATTKRSGALNMLGVVMSACCGLIDMASFSFAAQSLLAPFGALTLVINLLLAPLHGDKPSARDLLSTTLVFGGVATCLANANTEEATRTYAELRALLGRPQFHAWLALVALALALAATRMRAAPSSSALCLPLIAGALGGCTTLCAKSSGELAKAAETPWHTTCSVGAPSPPAPAIHSHVHMRALPSP